MRWRGVLIVGLLAACGGGDDRADLAGFVKAFNEREGASAELDDPAFQNLVETKRNVCAFDRATLEMFVAMALDQDAPEYYEDAVRFFCPDRADEVAEIVASTRD